MSFLVRARKQYKHIGFVTVFAEGNRYFNKGHKGTRSKEQTPFIYLLSIAAFRSSLFIVFIVYKHIELVHITNFTHKSTNTMTSTANQLRNHEKVDFLGC